MFVWLSRYFQLFDIVRITILTFLGVMKSRECCWENGIYPTCSALENCLLHHLRLLFLAGSFGPQDAPWLACQDFGSHRSIGCRIYILGSTRLYQDQLMIYSWSTRMKHQSDRTIKHDKMEELKITWNQLKGSHLVPEKWPVASQFYSVALHTKYHRSLPRCGEWELALTHFSAEDSNIRGQRSHMFVHFE